MDRNLKAWTEKVGRKPRVLILADVPGWAYDINSRGLREVLSGEFDIDIAYLHHGPYPDLRPDYYDFYHEGIRESGQSQGNIPGSQCGLGSL